MIIKKINGWIILDKQIGISSRTAVTKISRILKIKKVGHGGTLDPLASGVLPIALGEATKVISFIQDKQKCYSFTIKWGETTETDDLEGAVLERSEVRPNIKQINSIIPSFIGEILQKPPIYSAIKVNGQRSYKLARKNIEVNHEFRKVEIYDLILKKIINLDKAEFEVKCGKGTYVRSLAKDLAEKLHTKGHVIQLRRLSVGNFEEKDTILIDFTKEIIHSPMIFNKILPTEAVLDDIPALVLNKTEARQIKQGQKLELNCLENIDHFLKKNPNYNKFEKIYAVENIDPIALITIYEGIVKPARIINL
ncbi:tRNA pseudouridine(55) synthase TruB [Alphaproteobacteria bacterium]|nr:tRNA pseudouridine(55) synthase TruB [Alphaproteobacteria bacterium]